MGRYLAIGITIDPLKYDLLFERFLNPDRISLPDIDTDFDDDGQAYLYWGNNKLRYAKLRKNMILVDTSIGKNGVVEVELP